jgi:hypothetical protein
MTVLLRFRPHVKHSVLSSTFTVELDLTQEH